jgi:hypothetical protein
MCVSKVQHVTGGQTSCNRSLISFYRFLNIYKNTVTGNCTDPKCGQLQLKKDWTVVQSSSVLCMYIFSPVDWTCKH